MWLIFNARFDFTSTLPGADIQRALSGLPQVASMEVEARTDINAKLRPIPGRCTSM